MNFKLELDGTDIQNIKGIVCGGYSEQEQVDMIIKLFPDAFDRYSKIFNYEKFCDTKYEERNKWNFLPIDAQYIGDERNRAFKSFIVNINACIVSQLRKRDRTT